MERAFHWNLFSAVSSDEFQKRKEPGFVAANELANNSTNIPSSIFPSQYFSLGALEKEML